MKLKAEGNIFKHALLGASKNYTKHDMMRCAKVRSQGEFESHSLSFCLLFFSSHFVDLLHGRFCATQVLDAVDVFNNVICREKEVHQVCYEYL